MAAVLRLNHITFACEEPRRADGTTVVQTKTDDQRTWTIMRDPEGNPFCVE